MSFAVAAGASTPNQVLDGHGILMCAEWDIAEYLKSGRLVMVLPQYHTPVADIYAVYPLRHQMSARDRACADFVAGALGSRRGECGVNAV